CPTFSNLPQLRLFLHETLLQIALHCRCCDGNLLYLRSILAQALINPKIELSTPFPTL
ncbi:uncharacterized protein BDR25DRAFT_393954, partial [Lindgomyces ingoldianus]